MSAHEEIAELLGEIAKTRALLEKHRAYYLEFQRTDLATLGRKTATAIVMAELHCDFYTCVETLFLRVSQFFENNLAKDRWHQDLLRKMTLGVEGIRPAVVRDETASLLGEILRFRHFKRYYFEFDYDWDRLDYVQKKYEQVYSMLLVDLQAFENFLRQVEN